MITVYLLDHGDRAKKERGPGTRGLWVQVIAWERVSPRWKKWKVCVCEVPSTHLPQGNTLNTCYLHFSPVRLLYVNVAFKKKHESCSRGLSYWMLPTLEISFIFTFGNTDGLRGQISVALGHTASTFSSP